MHEIQKTESWKARKKLRYPHFSTLKLLCRDNNEVKGHWKDIDLRNKTESSEIKSHIYAQLISD